MSYCYLFRDKNLSMHHRGYPDLSTLLRQVQQANWQAPGMLISAAMTPCDKSQGVACALRYSPHTAPTTFNLVHWCYASRAAMVDGESSHHGQYESTVTSDWSRKGLRPTPIRFEPRPWGRDHAAVLLPGMSLYDPGANLERESPFDFNCPGCQTPVRGHAAIFAATVLRWRVTQRRRSYDNQTFINELTAYLEAVCGDPTCRQKRALYNKKARLAEAVLLGLAT